MKSSTLVYLIVALWGLAFVGSILLAIDVEGPRNLDTGFKRLDILVRGQLLAVLLALASAAAGFLAKGNRRLKIIGLGPIVTTLIAVSAITLFVVFSPEPTVEDTVPTRVPTAEAEPVSPSE